MRDSGQRKLTYSSQTERNADFFKIQQDMNLPKEYPENAPPRHQSCKKNVTNHFDYVFWMGDFNYRLDISKNRTEEYLKKCRNFTVYYLPLITVVSSISTTYNLSFLCIFCL